jgi:hypothetical protein
MNEQNPQNLDQLINDILNNNKELYSLLANSGADLIKETLGLPNDIKFPTDDAQKAIEDALTILGDTIAESLTKTPENHSQTPVNASQTPENHSQTPQEHPEPVFGLITEAKRFESHEQVRKEFYKQEELNKFIKQQAQFEREEEEYANKIKFYDDPFGEKEEKEEKEDKEDKDTSHEAKLMKKIFEEAKQPKVTIEELFNDSKQQHDLDLYISHELKHAKEQKRKEQINTLNQQARVALAKEEKLQWEAYEQKVFEEAKATIEAKLQEEQEADEAIADELFIKNRDPIEKQNTEAKNKEAKAKKKQDKKITKHNMKYLAKLHIGAPCCSKYNANKEPLSKKQIQHRLTSDNPKLLKDLLWIGHVKSFAYDDEGVLNVLVTTVKFDKNNYGCARRRDKVVHPENIYMF